MRWVCWEGRRRFEGILQREGTDGAAPAGVDIRAEAEAEPAPACAGSTADAPVLRAAFRLRPAPLQA